MTRGDDVAQSPGPAELKWGWSVVQVLVPFQSLLCQRVKEGQCTGHPLPKVGAARKLHRPATLAGRLA
jgi:hypothetical protein